MPSVATLLGAAVAVFASSARAQTCSMAESARSGCYPWNVTGAVTATACAGHGCCYSPSPTAGVPWCFYPQIPAPAESQCAAVSKAKRLDCHPEPNAYQQACQSRGCCWDSTATGGLAACFFPSSPGYSAAPSVPTTAGFTSSLSLLGAGPFRNDIQQPLVDVAYLTTSMSRIRITDPSNLRYEPLVPLDPDLPSGPPPGGIGAADFTVSVETAPNPFGLTVTRKSNGQVLFDTRVQSYTAVSDGQQYKTNGLVFEDQYLELTTVIPNANPNSDTPHIYGLAEHITSLQLPVNGTRGQTFTMLAKDQGTPIHNSLGGTSLYASQPFYIVLAEGQAFGVFFLNSNPADIILEQGKEFSTLTYRFIGGVFDLFVFTGPTPADVVAQYQAVVSKPRMPPRWALGFHLCRWGYDGVGNTEAIWRSMLDNQLPQESQWNDIDYMNAYRDFTLNSTAYPQAEMQAFIAQLHNNTQRYVMIVDPAISITAPKGTYPPYDQGMQDDVFIKGKDGSVFIGSVWPGATAFPDFLLNRTAAWWKAQFNAWHAMVPFDGAWIDMNEPSDFSSSSSLSSASAPSEVIGGSALFRKDAEQLEDSIRRMMASPEWQANPVWNRSGLNPLDPRWPPFLPGRTGGVQDLEQKTLAMSSVQSYPLSDTVTTTNHYNVHNLYGWSEGIATIAAVEEIRGKRGLVIGRSTFPTSGRYQGHWLGDNNSDWEDLYYSLTGIMTFNLIGMPLVGSDVCGFSYSRDTGAPTTPELCTRWMQAAAWTAPFYRNHNTIGKQEQAPSVFADPYRSIMRNALNERLSMVPYLYTAMATAHSNGTTVISPLFVPFYDDENVAAIDTQLMFGPSLLVSPVVTQGSTSRQVYFPPAGAPWYDWRTGKAVASNGFQTISAALDTIPVHVRAGSIVPAQTPNMTTTRTALNAFNLTVALAATPGAAATGQLFLDDGDSLLSYESGQYLMVEWTATASSADGSSGTLSGRPVVSGYNPPSTATLQSFRILGIKRWNNGGGSKITVNGQTPTNVVYDASNQVLTVSGGFAVPLSKTLDVVWASSRL